MIVWSLTETSFVQTAATMTMNSPESLAALYQVATKVQESTQGVATAELMREVGLKCISFNGVYTPSVPSGLPTFH